MQRSARKVCSLKFQHIYAPKKPPPQSREWGCPSPSRPALVPLGDPSLLPSLTPPPFPRNHWFTFWSVWISMRFLEFYISGILHCILIFFFHLTSFTQHNDFGIHQCRPGYQQFPCFYWVSGGRVYGSLCIQSPVGGQLGCSQFLVAIDKVSGNGRVQALYERERSLLLRTIWERSGWDVLWMCLLFKKVTDWYSPTRPSTPSPARGVDRLLDSSHFNSPFEWLRSISMRLPLMICHLNSCISVSRNNCTTCWILRCCEVESWNRSECSLKSINI